MTESQKGEREEALEAARFLVRTYASRRPQVGAEPYALVVARYLLSSAKAEGEMRDQIVMDWMRARADWDTDVGEACRAILNVFLAALPPADSPQQTTDRYQADGKHPGKLLYQDLMPPTGRADAARQP